MYHNEELATSLKALINIIGKYWFSSQNGRLHLQLLSYIY